MPLTCSAESRSCDFYLQGCRWYLGISMRSDPPETSQTSATEPDVEVRLPQCRGLQSLGLVRRTLATDSVHRRFQATCTRCRNAKTARTGWPRNVTSSTRTSEPRPTGALVLSLPWIVIIGSSGLVPGR